MGTRSALGSGRSRVVAVVVVVAADPANLVEFKQRLMELRRDAAAKAVWHEPARLQQLQEVLLEGGDEKQAGKFVTARIAHATALVAKLGQLAPATAADLPALLRLHGRTSSERPRSKT